MNRQILHMFALFTALFAILVGFTSYWAVFDADNLRGNPANRRVLLEQQRVPRGLILADDGTVLARNGSHRSGADRFYSRVYPTAGQFSNPVGYNFVDLGRAGLEQSYNGELVGESDELTEVLDELRGRRIEGRDLKTTLSPAAQRAAKSGLAGRPGAVVAIEVPTGAVKAMASVPIYDPNGLPEKFSRLTGERGSPLLNRGTQGKYPPGSVFKVVTAAAAIDSGKLTPTSTLDGSSPQAFATKELKNFGNKSYGEVTLSEALTNSINTAFANVGTETGKDTLFKYMNRFGLNRKPPIDLPKGELQVSGVYRGKKRLGAGDMVDIARVSIGQGGTLVTPLQMAMVVQTIANGGEQLEPYLVSEVVDRGGLVRSRRKPRKVGRAVKPETAEQLKEMMVNVVERGTGTAARLDGIQVAGKTGTAELQESGSLNQVWFIAFAPADSPRYAVAATVERSTGQGGTVVAPIVKQVLEALL